jgi:hypothetical protein
MTYRGHVKNGQILLEEPVRLPEGAEVQVELTEQDIVSIGEVPEPSDDPFDIEQWDLDWRRVGPLHYEPGERERVQNALEEADALAKATVQREMEHGA